MHTSHVLSQGMSLSRAELMMENAFDFGQVPIHRVCLVFFAPSTHHGIVCLVCPGVRRVVTRRFAGWHVDSRRRPHAGRRQGTSQGRRVLSRTGNRRRRRAATLRTTVNTMYSPCMHVTFGCVGEIDLEKGDYGHIMKEAHWNATITWQRESRSSKTGSIKKYI